MRIGESFEASNPEVSPLEIGEQRVLLPFRFDATDYHLVVGRHNNGAYQLWVGVVGRRVKFLGDPHQTMEDLQNYADTTMPSDLNHFLGIENGADQIIETALAKSMKVNLVLKR